MTSTAATYVDCDFSEAKLVKLDFQSSGFTRCRFAGVLRNVTFWDHGFENRALVELERDPRRDAQALFGFLEVYARWALPGQPVGILSLPDFEGLVDPAFVVDLVERLQRECSS